MNDKTRVFRAGIFVIVCLVTGTLLIVLHKANEKAIRKPLPGSQQVKAARPLPGISDDLYYLKHPYLIKGDQLNDERKYDSAIYYYSQASAKFEKEHQWDNYVWINGYIGRLYLYVAGMNHEDALPYLKKAFEKGKLELGGSHPYMAVTCYYLGLYYYKEKMADASLDMYNNALKILSANYTDDNIYAADIYDAVGNVHTNLLFDNIAAEKDYLRAIKIKESLPDEQGKPVLTASYYNVVNLSFLMGDFETAQSFCYEAIKNARYIKSHSVYWLELLEGMLASIYSGQKLYDKAVSRLRNVIDLNRQNNGDKSYLPFYYTSLGDIYAVTEKFDSAVWYYNKALALAAANVNAVFYDQNEQVAVTNYSLGIAFLKQKKYTAALTCLNRSLVLRLKVSGKKHQETARIFQALGDVYKEAGMADSALKYFQSGITACTANFNEASVYDVPTVANVDKNFYSFLIIRDKAFVLKQLYDNDPYNNALLYSSLAHYCLADSLMSLFRSEFERENARLNFNEANNNIYEEAIDCATSLYNKTKESRYCDLVFNFMDKRKSSLLLEAVNEKALLAKAGVPADEQKRLGRLQQELAYLQGQLEKENNKKDPEEPVLQVLHSRIKATEAKFNSLNAKLAKSYPFYASVQNTSDTVAIRDLEIFSRDNNSAVLEYFWGDKAVYLLGVYNGNREILKINRSTLMDAYLDTLRRNLAAGYVLATKEKDFAEFQNSGHYLFDYLVGPMLAALGVQRNGILHKPEIIVIPDGALSNIPFEALVVSSAMEKEVDYKKIHYLVNDYVISYDYSTRFLLRNSRNQNTIQDPAVLAFSFSNDHPLQTRAGRLSKLKSNNELPGAAGELNAIAGYMKGKFFMGDDATEESFKRDASAYDILHLAVHGEADDRNSYNSRLIFKNGRDSVNDGNLYAYEIYGLPLKARLAVLSACESGIGRFHAGESMYSMARAFVYAGCGAVVMSYWQVNDNSTQALVSGFYEHITRGNKINQSLRRTKLDYLGSADKRSAHPGNWAAFIAIGNMSPLATQETSAAPVQIMIILIAIGVAGYLAFRISRTRKYGRQRV